MLRLLFIASLLCFVAICNGLICWECEESFGQAECLRIGRAVECESNEEFCHLSLRHGGWGQTPWIEKTCKSYKSCADNYVQNARNAWASEGDQIQCNEFAPSSVCRCCCSGDLCNQDRTSCLVVNSCPDISPPLRGSFDCTDGFNLLSECEVSCRRGFSLQGPKVLVCDAFGNWSDTVPTCEPITCAPGLRTPEFGSMQCQRRSPRLGSRCRFSCEPGYRLFGQERVQCIDDRDGDEYGVWSSYQPTCRPLQCPRQRPLRHGSITCTDDNFVGSTCTFRCLAEQGYVLFPDVEPAVSVSLTCERDEHWSGDRPCCTLPCPPFAIMDFMVILDSSSSVGAANWNRTKQFVISFIREFSIRDDSTHVAAFRYNAEVDTSSQIFFDSYSNNREGLLEAIERIPYNGQGTNTGNAINHAANNVLRRGNRELARDIVLLITDGVSQDRVSLPARRLRRAGADVYVLPIQAGDHDVDLDQINAIAGAENPDHVLTDALDGGFDALNAAFAGQIIGLLCNQPCFNPLHNHPDDARLP